ncbi:MAG: type II toxin-antitoxin system HicA family toxin [Candidatus Sumerlaeota bacterium]|nr:type II toxin-antitoxin system HicA family toxin [Candidatus Sumerlaeota bacterium]
MGKLRPISHGELIAKLRRLGFRGPYAGGKHPLMIRNELRLTIPNYHGEDIGVDLLIRILRQGQISREEWESGR